MSLLDAMTHEELDGMIRRRDAEIAQLRANSDLVDKLHADRAKVDRLRAELAERDADVARLREELERAGMASMSAPAMLRAQIQAEQPRTDAEWKAADRKKRINDLAARYAGQLMAAGRDDGWPATKHIVRDARALAAAVVEAEE